MITFQSSTPPPPPTDDAIEAIIQQATSSRNAQDSRPLRDTRTQLFVGNLPYRVRWQDLKDLFRKAGTVLRADVALGPDNRSRGHGTVLLATAEEAGRAVDMFNGYSWQTRTLEVRLDRLLPEFDANQQPPASGSVAAGSGANIPSADEREYMAFFHPTEAAALPASGSQVTSRNLFVGNLPFHCQWQDLKDLFRQAGTILRADVALGPDGRSRGFGTVVFATDYDAERAVNMFNGYEYNGRALKVHFDRFSQFAGLSMPTLHPAAVSSFPSTSSAMAHLSSPSTPQFHSTASPAGLSLSPAVAVASAPAGMAPSLLNIPIGASFSNASRPSQAAQADMATFPYDFGTSDPNSLFSQLQGQFRSQQHMSQNTGQQQQSLLQHRVGQHDQSTQQVHGDNGQRGGLYPHHSTSQNKQSHPQQQQQQAQTLHQPQAQHSLHRTLLRPSTSGPPSTSASVALSSSSKSAASATDIEALSQSLATSSLTRSRYGQSASLASAPTSTSRSPAAGAGLSLKPSVSSTTSTSTTESTGSASEWSAASSSTSLSQALSFGGDGTRSRTAGSSGSRGQSRSESRSESQGQSPVQTKQGLLSLQQQQHQPLPQPQPQQYQLSQQQSRAAQRSLQLMSQNQERQRQQQHHQLQQQRHPGSIVLPPPPPAPDPVAFQMQMQMSSNTPQASGGGMWVGVLNSAHHHTASPYAPFGGTYVPYAYQAQPQPHATPQQQQPSYRGHSLPLMTPMPPFVMTHSPQPQVHTQPRTEGRSKGRHRHTPSTDATSSESSASSGRASRSHMSGERGSTRPSSHTASPTTAFSQQPFAFPLPSPGMFLPFASPLPSPGMAPAGVPHYAYVPPPPHAYGAHVTPGAHQPHPLRLNLAGVHGPFSPGVVMSPGTFYGRPGEVVPNPNPWINAAVGAPVHVNAVGSAAPGGGQGTGANERESEGEQRHAQQTGHPYPTHGSYFYAMSSPKQGPPSGMEPNSYFDPLYFPPGGTTHNAPLGPDQQAQSGEVAEAYGREGAGGEQAGAEERPIEAEARVAVIQPSKAGVAGDVGPAIRSEGEVPLQVSQERGRPSSRSDTEKHTQQRRSSDTPIVMRPPLLLKTKADSDPNQRDSDWLPAEQGADAASGDARAAGTIQELKLPERIPWRAAKAKETGPTLATSSTGLPRPK